mmetsp:Transcript_41487/g.99396  ORF Transcript_41487/g.99396 Transcript_41487/m.99396 type:complete len:573 (+) Transcript_41487:105-1823(+)
MGCNQSKDNGGGVGSSMMMMDKDGNQIANSTRDGRGGSAPDVSEPEEIDGELFYDAIESFSRSIAMMNYAPASTRMTKDASFRILDTMLREQTKTEGGDRKEEEGVAVQETIVATATVTTETETETTTKKTKTTRDSVAIVKEHLMEKRVNSNLLLQQARGYPGELTPEELDACLEFRQLLKDHPRQELKEMVGAYSPQEDEAFGICRFLRARDFDPKAVLAMLEEQNAADIWSKAKQDSFYANFDDIYGCPVPIFMSLFPVVVSGLAKNGATVFYFKSGEMDIDAIECIADLPELVPAVWDLLHNKGRLSMAREAKTHRPDMTILSERIILVDMKDYPSALFSSRGVEWMKNSAGCTACFPETMNRTYLVNVSRTFSIVWALVKIFLEARTLAKIGFFSNADKATQDLEKFVDSEELLSDYGGRGPSYMDVLAAQQKELGNGCTRFIVKHMVVTKRDCEFQFAVNQDEKIYSVVVYTKSDHSTDFTVVKGSGNKNGSKSTVVESTTVGRDTKTGQGKSNHYSVELTLGGSNAKTKQELTAGQYTIVAKHGSHSGKDHFLVAISLCPISSQP